MTRSEFHALWFKVVRIVEALLTARSHARTLDAGADTRYNTDTHIVSAINALFAGGGEIAVRVKLQTDDVAEWRQAFFDCMVDDSAPPQFAGVPATGEEVSDG